MNFRLLLWLKLRLVLNAFRLAGAMRPAVLLTTTASLLRIRSHSHRELDGSNIAFVDEQRHYLDVTDGVCALLGYSRSELLTMRIDDVTAPVMRSNTAHLFERYLADGLQHGEYVLLHRNGTEVPINYTCPRVSRRLHGRSLGAEG
jgi:PAS domain S-box-containing protein